MTSIMQGGRKLPWKVLALSLGVGLIAGLSARAGDGTTGAGRGHKAGRRGLIHRAHVPATGTLGYGPPGLHPGFQGFGLGFHRGYGYGGKGLGVGAFGGYPFYGGPGYPHPWPRLQRIGGINPFPYYGGPGHPVPGQPNYYGGVGPLVADPPVVTIIPVPGEANYASGFGAFTGAAPYPEAAFAPFTSAAAVGGSYSGVVTSAPPPPSPPPVNPGPAD